MERAAGGVCRPTGNIPGIGSTPSDTDIYKDEEEAWGKYCSIAEWDIPVKTIMTGCKDACGVYQQPCVNPHRGGKDICECGVCGCNDVVNVTIRGDSYDDIQGSEDDCLDTDEWDTWLEGRGGGSGSGSSGGGDESYKLGDYTYAFTDIAGKIDDGDDDECITKDDFDTFHCNGFEDTSAYTYQYEDYDLVGGWKGLGGTRQVCE